ncbi:MAG: type IV pilus twitching motility protein PilT [Desulfovibrio sp.]|uniref:type IV pilus twitching motility protein PilT n=1 Tax=Desulfovibrio sp. 7SRBS1 TaxID=3378064 RepID=UPI003B406253
MAQITAFFQLLHKNKGSDLHLSSGQQPFIRLHGELVRVTHKELSDQELREILAEIVPEEKMREFDSTGDVDFGLEIPDLARYRGNLFRQSRGISAVFREVPQIIESIDALGLPPLLKELAMQPKGLVLVTGPTGSGKSTTLAAMLDHANEERRDHIITIEDPIEFVHQPKGCLINQREVGRDTRDFKTALRGALREDPDIILVGEMRDLETIQLALEAAETGHLVLSTVHTISAAKTVDRIIEVFPANMQAQIRTSLADSLRAIISQVLFKRKDRPGRVAALEILTATSPVRNLIRENKTFQLTSVIQTGKANGMRLLDDDIQTSLEKGYISAEDAHAQAFDKDRFKPFLSS